MSSQPQAIAKITWEDPLSKEKREFVLVEGATASIGRSEENTIQIPEKHVSRRHAEIQFRDGIFMITDLRSANGTFVNDRRLIEAFPLAHGDIIRLYVPILNFSAIVTDEEVEVARKTGTLVVPSVADSGKFARLLVTAGPMEGQEFILKTDSVTVGRATQDTVWDIPLNDRAVSRPHCRFSKKGDTWSVMDLGSANGTTLNGSPVTATPRPLKDGDVVSVGETMMLFRLP
jgi:pSer/pThr/pTyr-binding forkhead associated (FHA) protein